MDSCFYVFCGYFNIDIYKYLYLFFYLHNIVDMDLKYKICGFCIMFWINLLFLLKKI